MTAIPLDKVRLRWCDHKSALWWLFELYRRPLQFQAALQPYPFRRQFRSGLIILLHASIYFAVLVAVNWMFTLVRPNHGTLLSTFGQIVLGLLNAVAIGFAYGIGGVTFSWFTKGISATAIAEGIAAGTTIGTMASVASVLMLEVGEFLSSDIAGGIAVAIYFAGSLRIAIACVCRANRDTILVIIAGVFYSSILGAFGPASGIAFAVIILRAYYYPFHLLLVWPKLRNYELHPAAWDDLCFMPFPGLDSLLAKYAEQSSPAGDVEIERLLASYRCLRTEAIRARIRVVARRAGRVTNLSQLSTIVAKLPEGKEGLLSDIPQLRKMINTIVTQQMHVDMLERPFFKEYPARQLCAEIEKFQGRIGTFRDPIAPEFWNASIDWEENARNQLDKIAAIVHKQHVPDVFRASGPVDSRKEAFVRRDAILEKLEQLATMATGCPGIVLYGRKRRGKSTVLQNLDRFLPKHVVPIVISMMNPQLFISSKSFVDRVARDLQSKNFIAEDIPQDISSLYDVLSNCNSRLEAEGKRLLLAFDEYEMIDWKIGQGVFTEDLLRVFRESTQNHRNIIWLFSGNHEISDLPNAPWSSYLVSARTIEVAAFTLTETQILLTEPLKHSNIGLLNDPRSQFEPRFWSDGGIERIHDEAGGWPHLVQLIAQIVVDLVNNEEAEYATPTLLDHALTKCLVEGKIVIEELMRGESKLPGEWDYLLKFRESIEQLPPKDLAIYRSLRRRELVAEGNSRWRLKVPLMARWVRESCTDL